MLVLRALGLGDALTGVPALRGVRRRWPGAHLVLAAPAVLGGWLRDLGVVDAVLPLAGLAALAPGAVARAAAEHPGVLEGPVDVAVNLHGRGPQSTAALAAVRPGLLVAFAAGSAEGSEGAESLPSAAGGALGAAPRWVEEEHEVHRWCRLVRSVGGDCGPDDLLLAGPVASPVGGPREGPVLLHPGAAAAARRWPVERWAAVAAALAARGHEVLVTGSTAERGLCAAVARAAGARGHDLAGTLDLPGLAGAVTGAALVVCGDTGVAHLATALRARSVLLFGPTPPALWGPAVDPERHLVLWPAPAGYRGDPHGERLDPVLAATTVADVLAAGDVLTAAGGRAARP